jgi:hypothetical protein
VALTGTGDTLGVTSWPVHGRAPVGATTKLGWLEPPEQSLPKLANDGGGVQ